MSTTPIMPPNRHIPYKKGGWGYAILTTAAAVAAFLTAYYIHTQTYRHPTDVMMRQVGERPDGGQPEVHNAAAGAPAPSATPGR